MEDIRDTLSGKLRASNRHKQSNKEYSLLNTDEDRVIYTMKLLKQYNMPPKIDTENGKSIEKSVEYKNEANKLYTMPKRTSQLQLNEIIELYTMSVAYAPPNSRELSMAYANRSAALCEAKLYDDCLIDIERALQLNYPDELKAKLYARKVRCIYNLSIEDIDRPPGLDDAMDQTREWLKKMDLNNAGRVIIEKTLDNTMNVPMEKQRVKFDDMRNLPAIPNDNPEVPGASSAIAINYSEEFGRHIVATRDIEPGEILAVQDAYSWILHPNKIYTHCSNCSRQTWCGIPCDHCVLVIYCSENCRNDAWNNNHDIECQVVGPLVALKMANLAIFAMRIVIKAVKEAGSIQGLMNKLLAVDSHTDERTCGFVDNIFNDQKYESVYMLTRNTESRSVPDLFGRSLNSFYMMFMLATRSELFGKRLNGDLEELGKNKMVTFIGGLIMRHRQIIPSNAHTMYEENDRLPDPVERGAALMPFLSLFNHSCNPSVDRKSFGTMQVLYSDRIVKKGEQIFDSYGMFHVLYSKTVRQALLFQQYYFECDCVACEEDWPLYANLPSYVEKKLPIAVKKKIAKACKNLELYYNIAAIGDVENKPKIIEDLVYAMKCICLYVQFPCLEFDNALGILKKVRALFANRYLSLN